MPRHAIGDLNVIHPYKTLTPVQVRMMEHTYAVLRARKDGQRVVSLLEAGTGSGKTLSLLSTITSFSDIYPDVFTKIIFLCRTIPVVDHVLREIGLLNHARATINMEKSQEPGRKLTGNESLRLYRALPLTSRRRLCINEEIRRANDINTACIKITKGCDLEDTQVCKAYVGAIAQQDVLPFESQAYHIDNFIGTCKSAGICPYFASRHAVTMADIIVCNYNYLLDPKCSGPLASKLDDRALILIDEAHNLEHVACEAFSMHISRPLCTMCRHGLTSFLERVNANPNIGTPTLNLEHSILRKEKAITRVEQDARLAFSRSTPYDSIDLTLTVPASARSPALFIAGLSRTIDFFETLLGDENNVVSTPKYDVQRLYKLKLVDTAFLQCAPEVLHYYFSLYNFFDPSLQLLVQFLALLGLFGTPTVDSGHAAHSVFLAHDAFVSLIHRPSTDVDVREGTYQQNIFSENSHSSTYRLICQDALIAMRPLYQYFSCILFVSATLFGAGEPGVQIWAAGQPTSSTTSGHGYTFSLIEKLLGLQRFNEQCEHKYSLQILRLAIETIDKHSYFLDIIGKGADQAKLTTRYLFRMTVSAFQNYARILSQLAGSTADGMLVFFPSYRFMEDLTSIWNTSGFLSEISAHKLVFFETPDPVETLHALEAYRRACDGGRGALFFAIARGRLSEGIDFRGHHARLVIVIGVPFLYSGSPFVHLKLHYLQMKYGVSVQDYLRFDAGRVVAQCIGRVMRGPNDYAAIILADERFTECKDLVAGATGDPRDKSSCECTSWSPAWMRQLLPDKSHPHDAVVRSATDFLIRQAHEANRLENQLDGH
ncbi:TFIIH basal transcription factor complex helicase subunit [Giardia muris]|uniref:TFIIH basal transcription factor complex helicase subunit n=1 Tax=Giardia muris TaxID=5742 RepID=A0A4Z1SXF7_GIAMU|nr:TFIIH basal transcription factor complex helicase subunit [Giardia muris]|eukprot:TNJ30386.1 TFIIH basal transcription factor complex helicase subunit [Giardia muris]